MHPLSSTFQAVSASLGRTSAASNSPRVPPSNSASAVSLSFWWVGAGSTLTSAVTLIGGHNATAGNVMIGGQPVCDDGWDAIDAGIVCRQLGYLNGSATVSGL